MLNKITKKTILVLMLVIMILTSFSKIVQATVPTSVVLKNDGDCGYHLQFWDTKQNAWSFVSTKFIYYEENGQKYPAYCLEREKKGPETYGEYSVTLERAMEDVRLWRVAINGYPYQTPEEMGLYNKEDAFVATKQSIYCILYDNEPETYYRGGDARGTAIKNAIVRLVNIGRYGTQTPYNTDINVSKIGELFEDGEFYSQEYCIDSPIKTSNYFVTVTNGMPENSIITNMDNVQTTSFDGSEHFKIRIPKEQLTQDLDIVVVIQAKCKTYPVFYGKSSIPEAQDNLITFDPYGDLGGRAILNYKTNSGEIKVVKNDVETNLPIEGVTFQLAKKDGTVIANATTNIDGIATFPNLYQGDYVLKELYTNENYILNDSEFNVNVQFNKTTEITITNEHKKGSLKIYKVDKDNNKINLGNVEFNLYSNELGKVIGTYYTDENGELNIKNLRTGTYKLIETKTNKWYNLSEDTEIEVRWDEETQKMIENELKKGQIRIIKVDKDNKEIKLKGVEFEVIDENGNVLEKIVTDKNGEALTSRYALRDFKNLKIRESKTLDEYVLDEQTQTIELKENQIIDVFFDNEKIKGTLEITKVDSKDKDKKIEGVKFGLYDINDNLIETLKTDSEGKATSKELYKGKYYLKELETNSSYYLLNEDTFEFEIVNHQETVSKLIENEPTDITVGVEKTGTIEIKPGDKVDYTFSNISNNSNTYLDSFKWFDYIPADHIRIDKMTTGTWNQDLSYNVYYKTNKSDDYILFKENLSTQENYDLDFTEIQLNNDDYITETYFDFGRVEKGFRESESPTMQCKSLDTLNDDATFTNRTRTVGIYHEVTAESDSTWTTIVHKPKKPEPVLPKTGK